LKLSIEYISFSAHVDYQQNSQFIEEVASPNLILVHGDSNEMSRLRSALQSKYADKEQPLIIYTPRNCETVELYFKGEKLAKTIGTLAEVMPQDGDRVTGALVVKDYQYQIMSFEELPEYTDLVEATVDQKQVIPCRAPFTLVRWLLECMYGEVKNLDPCTLQVFGCVKVTQEEEEKVILEWKGSPVNDMIADSVVTVVLQAESSPASVKATQSNHHHHHHHHKDEPVIKEEATEKEQEEMISNTLAPEDHLVEHLLQAQFGKGVKKLEDGSWSIRLDAHEATLTFGKEIEVLYSMNSWSRSNLNLKNSKKELR
jgi:cleavage and polyadenylation specificity factor subunit 3